MSDHPAPPPLALRVLRRTAPPEIREQVMDDLLELSKARDGSSSALQTHIWFWCQALKSLPPFIRERIYWKFSMSRNYAVIALRNIAKQKLFSAINIMGFAISLVFALLIVRLLLSFYGTDRFHADAARIFRVVSTVQDSEAVHEMATAPLPLHGELRQLAGIDAVARIRKGFQGDARAGERILPLTGLYTEPEFFRLFSFRLRRGDPEKALAEPFSIVLTPETAARLFPGEDPLGKVVSVGALGDFRVTGLLEDTRRLQTHIRFECLTSLATLRSLEQGGIVPKRMDKWTDFNLGYVYVRLKKTASPAQVSAALPDIAQRNIRSPQIKVSFSVQPLKSISPGPTLSNELSFSVPRAATAVLVLLGFVILAIAGFNYTNLSLAKILGRAKEVGIRKVIGADRRQLVGQFIGEAVVIALISLVFAVFLLQALLPVFYTLNSELRLLAPLKGLSLKTLLVFIGFAAATGMIVGLFPALLLSKLPPALVLKDVTKARLLGRFSLRRAFILVQFFISFILLTTTLIGLRQARFLRTFNYGFDPSGILNVDLQEESYRVFKQELEGTGGIQRISASACIPNTGVTWPGRMRYENAPEAKAAAFLAVDENFLPNLGIGLAAGRNFPPEAAGPGEKFALVNEAAVRSFGLARPEDVLGKSIRFDEGPPLLVIGVVRDFSFGNALEPVRPLALRFMPENFLYANLKVAPDRFAETRRFVENRWRALFPMKMFRADFYENQLRQSLFGVDTLVKAVGFLALLALSISFLGLIGMVVFDMESRVKEIGVRRVLGATRAKVSLTLAARFVKIMTLASLLAMPAAWFTNQLYLRSFAFRVRLGPASFLLGLILMLGAGLVIIVSQSVQAARANPAVSLRSE